MVNVTVPLRQHTLDHIVTLPLHAVGILRQRYAILQIQLPEAINAIPKKSDKCICKEGYTGKTCADKMLDVDCTKMDITINPYGYSDLTSPFNGEVYFADDNAKFDDLSKLSDPLCKFDDPAKPYKFDAVAAGTTCGNVPIKTVTKTFYAYIKHSKAIKSVEDQILEITCTGSSTTSVSIINTLVDSSKSEVQQTTVSKVDDVTMKVRKDGGNTLTDFQLHDTVKVNDNIALTLESGSNFMIKSCKVTDGGSAEIEVIKNWCVANPGLLLYSSKIVAVEKDPSSKKYPYGLTVNTNAVKLPLKAVKFTTGSQMMFTCELCTDKTCHGAYTACTTNLHIGDDFKTYQGAIQTAIQNSRRRRSVTNGTVGTSISVSVTVDEYKELLKEANESKETECFKSAVVLLPLILLASLLVIAMGMTFFFCNKFTQNMTEGQSNIGFKA